MDRYCRIDVFRNRAVKMKRHIMVFMSPINSTALISGVPYVLNWGDGVTVLGYKNPKDSTIFLCIGLRAKQYRGFQN
jgi:hypothetical protein